MKAGIHPKYEQVKVTCVCGNVFTTGTTKGSEIRTEICAACHPFYTGTQRIVDTEGRVDRFMKKFEKADQMRAAASKRVAAKDASAPTTVVKSGEAAPKA